MNNLLFEKTQKIGFIPKIVAEVGVYLPQTSNVLGFINQGISTMLVEPDPLCITKIEEYFTGKDNVKVFQNAIYTENTEIELYRTNASTFVSTLSSSPALVNDKYLKQDKDKFTAVAIKFSDIDSGNIDLLSIDTEGCEWFVISTMLSRPQIISIETHAKNYINPYLKDLNNWMLENNYTIWYIDKSDTVFIKNEFTNITLFDKLINKFQLIRYKLNFKQ